VIDLMEALKKSLQSRRPPASAEEPSRSRTAAKKPAPKRKTA